MPAGGLRFSVGLEAPTTARRDLERRSTRRRRARRLAPPSAWTGSAGRRPERVAREAAGYRDAMRRVEPRPRDSSRCHPSRWIAATSTTAPTPCSTAVPTERSSTRPTRCCTGTATAHRCSRTTASDTPAARALPPGRRRRPRSRRPLLERLLPRWRTASAVSVPRRGGGVGPRRSSAALKNARPCAVERHWTRSRRSPTHARAAAPHQDLRHNGIGERESSLIATRSRAQRESGRRPDRQFDEPGARLEARGHVSTD